MTRYQLLVDVCVAFVLSGIVISLVLLVFISFFRKRKKIKKVKIKKRYWCVVFCIYIILAIFLTRLFVIEHESAKREIQNHANSYQNIDGCNDVDKDDLSISNNLN